MRILVIGDLHGRLPELSRTDVDFIISPGDICGDHGIRPLIRASMKEFEEDPESARYWYEMVGEEQAKELLAESLERGRAVLEKLAATGLPVYIIPGNWDWVGEQDYWEYLSVDRFSALYEDLENVWNFEDCLVELDGIDLIGYGRVNGPELLELRGVELTEEELEEDRLEYRELFDVYAAVFEHAQQPVVFVAHNVPYDTALDRIDDSDNSLDGAHFGSVLVRDLVEAYQPLLVIGAHMHETFGSVRIGKTLCVNAGFGPDKHTIIEIADGKLVSVDFLPPDAVVVRPE